MLCFSKFPVAKNSMDRKRGYLVFPSESFCLTVPNSFAGEPFVLCFRTFPVTKKIMDKRGVSKISVEIFLSYSAEKFRRVSLLCCV